MLWFEPFPVGRWALVLVVAAVAAYVEFRPDPTTEAPFATVAIAPGDAIDDTNTELRRVPADLLETARRGDVATMRIPAGWPVMSSAASEEGRTVPAGWWVVGVALPEGADVGDEVRLVLLDSGAEVAGVVASSGSDDPFAAADGGVAVPPASAAEVAVAAANGRMAVLVSSG
ncbi:MAG TPA: hypothetical protein VMP13_05510 [Acidimicrobiia bacterium]|nr:hypothetical protein [Acidimicrobiia bacterium]